MTAWTQRTRPRVKRAPRPEQWPGVPASAFPKARKRRRRLEEPMQIALLNHIGMYGHPNNWGGHPDPVLFVAAIPNGAAMSSPMEGERMKEAGMVSGVPDLLFIFHGRHFWLELKTSKREGRKGRLTDDQRATHTAMRSAGGEIEVAYGLEEAIAICERWGFFRLKATIQGGSI